MNFAEICRQAENTRDEVYGWKVGSDRFGYDAVMFYDDINTVESNEPTESEYRKMKREKAENVARYRVEIMARGEFSYDNAAHRDEAKLNNCELAFVAGAIRSGLIEPITEDDLLDAEL